MTSKVYAYGGSGESLYVSERLPSRQSDNTTGVAAKMIHDSADFICVSSCSRDDNKWFVHPKTGGEVVIPLLQTGDYSHLMAECEKIAGRSGLVVLFC